MSKLSKLQGWNKETAKHLLSRTLIGFNRSQIDFAISLELDDFIDNYLLTPLPIPDPPGTWVNDNPNPTNGEHYDLLTKELVHWWITLCNANNLSIQERMVLFWHNHFVSESRKVWQTQRMYWQNTLHRNYFIGNLKEYTKAITKDAAMLQYLDGTDNWKGKINENYARELLELFTIGIGNYSQEDIKEAAKSLTGWLVEVDKLEPVFNTDYHDYGTKTFFGKSGNFSYLEIIDIIFDKDETALFIVNKLCKEFLEPNPDVEVVKELSVIFKTNGFEIKPVLSKLFKSQYFYSKEVKGCLIKSPAQFIFCLIKNLEALNLNLEYIEAHFFKLEQSLFNPPDVRGWLGHKKWINSTTFPERNNFSDSIITGYNSGVEHGIKIDLLSFIKSIKEHNNVHRLVEELLFLFLPINISPSRKDFLIEILLQGSPEYSWSIDSTDAEYRLKNLLKVLFRFPEFQLI